MIKRILESAYAKIEARLGAYTKTAIGALAAIAVISSLSSLLSNPTNIHDNTVMILRGDERGGGSGAIISSSNSESRIITNSHVCEGVKQGGLVVTGGNKYAVQSMQISQIHDLCLITVKANLHAQTRIASFNPPMFEPAVVSGHPALLPNVVTSGHFSGRRIIEVLVGFRPCTDAEASNPKLGFFCMLLGGLPNVKRYEAVLVTATIMPGSSGSGVYNGNNELAGLVFAGSGTIGYAYTVPLEYVQNFLEKELRGLPVITPDNTISVADLMSQNRTTEEQKLKIRKLCISPETKEQEDFCTIFNRSLM